MFNEIKWPSTPFDLKSNLVMAMEVGSVSHGTKIPPSDPDSIDDIDIMAVAIAPKEYYLGLKKWEGANSIKGEWDVVIYEFRKYIRLLIKQNPNVIGTLWLDNYIYLSPLGRRVVENRALFQHRKRSFDSFVGYATAQLKKMERGAFKGYMGEKRKELVERYGYDCYLENETEFLTDKGWLRFDEIDTGTDFLGTVKPESGKFEYQKAVSSTDRLYSGKMYVLEPYMSRAIVTPNHNLLLSAAHRSKKNNFSIKYEEEKSDWQLINLKKVFDNNRSHFHFRRTAICERKDFSLIDDNFLKLMGMYISEGTAQFRDKNKKRFKCIRITQKTGVKFIEEMMALEKAYNIKRYDYEKETVWMLHGPIARKIFEDINYSHEKHLPSWVYELSYRQAMLLWDYMVLGDGTQYPYGDVYYTANKKLAGDIHAMMTSAGILCSVNGPYRAETNYGIVEMCQIYKPRKSSKVKCINLGQVLKSNELPKKKKGWPVKEIDINDGRIVCFEVPNGTLITRSNGKVAIHGNCKNGSHLIRLLHMGIEYLDTCRLEVKRTWDRDMLMSIKRGEWPIQRVKDYAENKFDEIKAVYESSEMQEELPLDIIEKLLIECLEEKLWAR